MTEIPVFPAGSPPEAIAEPGAGPDVFDRIYRAIVGIGAKLPDPQRIRYDRSQNVWPVTIDPVPITLTAGAGILDLPQLLGPTLGHWWDIHLISAQGFTAGNVQGYKNLSALGNVGTISAALRAPFPAAGVLTFGKNHCGLRHGERLSFVATGITGIVLISLEATCVTEPYVGDYLI